MNHAVYFADLENIAHQTMIKKICKELQTEGFTRHGLELPIEQAALIDEKLIPGLILNDFLVILLEEIREDGEILAGIAICQPSFSTYKMEQTLILQDLYVVPEQRRNGIAERIIAFMERAAKNLDYCRIELTTTANNVPAAKLYTKLGYTGCQAVADGSMQEYLQKAGHDPSSYAVLVKKTLQ